VNRGLFQVVLCALLLVTTGTPAWATCRPETCVGGSPVFSPVFASQETANPIGTPIANEGYGYDFASEVHKYLYVKDNPVSWTDFSGHDITPHDQERLNQFCAPDKVDQAIGGGVDVFNQTDDTWNLLQRVNKLSDYYESGPRYAYSRKHAWLDLKHVTAAACVDEVVGYDYGDVYGDLNEGAQFLGSLAPWNDQEDAANLADSAFEYEDILSNHLGYKYYCHGHLGVDDLVDKDTATGLVEKTPFKPSLFRRGTMGLSKALQNTYDFFDGAFNLAD
jgi:hypothetical protein